MIQNTRVNDYNMSTIEAASGIVRLWHASSSSHGSLKDVGDGRWVVTGTSAGDVLV